MHKLGIASIVACLFSTFFDRAAINNFFHLVSPFPQVLDRDQSTYVSLRFFKEVRTQHCTYTQSGMNNHGKKNTCL